MFAYFRDDIPVGYLEMQPPVNGVCGLGSIVVLPEHRHNGYGHKLLDFCKQRAKELGAEKIKFGMIDDNKRLRK